MMSSVRHIPDDFFECQHGYAHYGDCPLCGRFDSRLVDEIDAEFGGYDGPIEDLVTIAEWLENHTDDRPDGTARPHAWPPDVVADWKDSLHDYDPGLDPLCGLCSGPDHVAAVCPEVWPIYDPGPVPPSTRLSSAANVTSEREGGWN